MPTTRQPNVSTESSSSHPLHPKTSLSPFLSPNTANCTTIPQLLRLNSCLGEEVSPQPFPSAPNPISHQALQANMSILPSNSLSYPSSVTSVLVTIISSGLLHSTRPQGQSILQEAAKEISLNFLLPLSFSTLPLPPSLTLPTLQWFLTCPEDKTQTLQQGSGDLSQLPSPHLFPPPFQKTTLCQLYISQLLDHTRCAFASRLSHVRFPRPGKPFLPPYPSTPSRKLFLLPLD